MKEGHGHKGSIKTGREGQGKESLVRGIGWRQGHKKGRRKGGEARNALWVGIKADGTTKTQARVESVKERGRGGAGRWGRWV